MKIALLSFHNALNYGASLQAFSLQHALHARGLSSEYINYVNATRAGFYSSWIQFKLLWKEGYKKRALMILIGAPMLLLRKRAFEKFYRTHLKVTPRIYRTSQECSELNGKYDKFIAGSDQIWNPVNNGKDTAYLLDFVKEPLQKISYASSFGTDTISADLKPLYKKALENIGYLSTREKAGVDLIWQLTGKKAAQVIDPVFLTPVAECERLISPCLAAKPFVFLYTNQRSQHNQFIARFGKQFSEIHLLSTHVGLGEMLNRKLRLRVAMSPNDFLSEIKHASLVITASFHCLAFAILLKKPFMAVLSGKAGKDERLLNLLRLTGLSHRILTEKTTYQEMITPIDYSKVQELLQTEIARSADFLFRALAGTPYEN